MNNNSNSNNSSTGSSSSGSGSNGNNTNIDGFNSLFTTTTTSDNNQQQQQQSILPTLNYQHQQPQFNHLIGTASTTTTINNNNNNNTNNLFNTHNNEGLLDSLQHLIAEVISHTSVLGASAAAAASGGGIRRNDNNNININNINVGNTNNNNGFNMILPPIVPTSTDEGNFCIVTAAAAAASDSFIQHHQQQHHQQQSNQLQTTMSIQQQQQQQQQGFLPSINLNAYPILPPTNSNNVQQQHSITDSQPLQQLHAILQQATAAVASASAIVPPPPPPQQQQQPLQLPPPTSIPTNSASSVPPPTQPPTATIHKPTATQPQPQPPRSQASKKNKASNKDTNNNNNNNPNTAIVDTSGAGGASGGGNGTKRKMGPFFCEHESCDKRTPYLANKNRLRHERTPHTSCNKSTCKVCLELDAKASNTEPPVLKESQRQCIHTGCEKMITVSNFSRHMKKPHHYSSDHVITKQVKKNRDQPIHVHKFNCEGCIEVMKLKTNQQFLEDQMNTNSQSPSLTGENNGSDTNPTTGATSTVSTTTTQNTSATTTTTNSNNNNQTTPSPAEMESIYDIRVEDDNLWTYYLNLFSHVVKQYSIYVYEDDKAYQSNRLFHIFPRLSKEPKRLIGCYCDIIGLIYELLKLEKPEETEILVKITFDINVNKKTNLYQKVGCIQLLYDSKAIDKVRSPYDLHQFFISSSEINEDLIHLFNANELSQLNADLNRISNSGSKVTENGKTYDLSFCLTTEMTSLVGLVGLYGIFKIIAFFKCAWCDVSIPLIGSLEKIVKIDTIRDILRVETQNNNNNNNTTTTSTTTTTTATPLTNDSQQSDQTTPSPSNNNNESTSTPTTTGASTPLPVNSEIHLRNIEAMVESFKYLSKFTPSTRKRIAKRYKGQISVPLIPSIPFVNIVPEPLELISGVVKNIFRYQLRDQSLVDSNESNREIENFLRNDANVSLFRGGIYQQILKIRERFDHSIINPLDAISIVTKQDKFLPIIEQYLHHPLKDFIPILWKQLWALISIMMNTDKKYSQDEYLTKTFKFAKLLISLYGTSVINTPIHVFIHHIGYYLEKYGSLFKFSSNGAKKRQNINNLLTEKSGSAALQKLDKEKITAFDTFGDILAGSEKFSVREYHYDRRYRESEGSKVSFQIRELFNISQFNLEELFNDNIMIRVNEILLANASLPRVITPTSTVYASSSKTSSSSSTTSNSNSISNSSSSNGINPNHSIVNSNNSNNNSSSDTTPTPSSISSISISSSSISTPGSSTEYHHHHHHGNNNPNHNHNSLLTSIEFSGQNIPVPTLIASTVSTPHQPSLEEMLNLIDNFDEDDDFDDDDVDLDDEIIEQ